MERIIPLIEPGQHGPAVANLQEALLFVVGKPRLSPRKAFGDSPRKQQNAGSGQKPGSQRLNESYLEIFQLPQCQHTLKGNTEP
jgi:hypothetical protein